MSAINGDKARFHRIRKQKIARRARKREMLKALAKQTNTAAPRLDTKLNESGAERRYFWGSASALGNPGSLPANLRSPVGIRRSLNGNAEQTVAPTRC